MACEVLYNEEHQPWILAKVASTNCAMKLAKCEEKGYGIPSKKLKILACNTQMV